MRGHNPAWANLPRRHCDDCGKLYKPVQPLRKDTRGFCSDNCRKSYHKHGGAYRKLRGELEKMFNKELARRMRLEEPCELCQGKGALWNSNGNGTKSPSSPCPKCINGAVLTPYGREVLDLVDRRLGGTLELIRCVKGAAPSANPSAPSPAKKQAR